MRAKKTRRQGTLSSWLAECTRFAACCSWLSVLTTLTLRLHTAKPSDWQKSKSPVSLENLKLLAAFPQQAALAVSASELRDQL
jgi:hypothetical protein